MGDNQIAGGGQAENGGQQAENGGQQAENGGRQAENGGQADQPINELRGDGGQQQPEQRQVGEEPVVKKKNQRGTRAGWRVREAKKIDFLARLNERMGQIVADRYRGNWRGGRGGRRHGRESS